MKIAIATSNNAYDNLALEEALLKDANLHGDILLIYINDHFVICGRNQNILAEVNQTYARDHHIQVARRISGGGAVYHDRGNVNFSFITDNNRQSYQKFLAPIIAFLKSLGLDAQFQGKNDLVVNGYKVSGNAQYKFKNRMFHHGTILFNSDLSVLSQCLKPNQLKLASKAITSIRQRVSNLAPLLKPSITVDQFVDKLVAFFIKTNDGVMFDLNHYHNPQVALLQKKQRSQSWLGGENPQFTIHNARRFSGGTINFHATVNDGKIAALRFSGDFLSRNDFEMINRYLLGTNYDVDSVAAVLAKIDDFEDYFGTITYQQLLMLMFDLD